jgi:hypothetical protein
MYPFFNEDESLEYVEDYADVQIGRTLLNIKHVKRFGKPLVFPRRFRVSKLRKSIEQAINEFEKEKQDRYDKMFDDFNNSLGADVGERKNGELIAEEIF